MSDEHIPDDPATEGHYEIGPTGRVRKIRKPGKPKVADAEKNPHAQALSRLRMSSLSPEERSAIATHASRAAQAASTPEFRQARAQKAIAARWARHTRSADPRLDPVAYLLSRGKVDEAGLSHEAYTISAARYARRYLLIRLVPRPDGWAGRADRLLSYGLHVRYTHRENGFIASVPQTERFIKLHFEGWDASVISGKLIAPTIPEKDDGQTDG